MNAPIPPPPARTGRPGALEPETAPDMRHDAATYEEAFDGLMTDAGALLPALPDGEVPDDDTVDVEIAAMVRAHMAGAAATMALAYRTAQVAVATERAANALERIADQLDTVHPDHDSRNVGESLESIANSLTGDGPIESAISRVGR